MTPTFFNIADMVNPLSGKTYREENAAIEHKIPIGTLVEFKTEEWLGDGACQLVHARMWVVKHSRDCDKTPLYGVSRWRDPEFALKSGQVYFGLGEESLTVVTITEAILMGENALEWPESQE